MEREYGSTTDEQILAAIAKIKERDRLISEISDTTTEIHRLCKIRVNLRTEARRLKNPAIAHITGLTAAIIDSISRCKYKRISQLDPEFYDRDK